MDHNNLSQQARRLRPGLACPRSASPARYLRLAALGALVALGSGCAVADDAADEMPSGVPDGEPGDAPPVGEPPIDEPPLEMPPGSPGAAPAIYGYYTRHDSAEDWETHQLVGQYADIIVQISPSERVMFWRGSSYRPGWVTASGTTYVDQLFETAGDGDALRWDKLNRHSHVRIIRQTADEVVVHWRYAPEFETVWAPMIPGWTGWIDEYYSIRSDRTMTRLVYSHDEGEQFTFRITLEEDGRLTQTLVEEGEIALGPPAVDAADRLPTGPDRGFGATYTKLGYSGPWDLGPDDDYAPASADWNANWQVGDHPDVVVDFDGNNTSWVFWRGLGFVPSMVSENGAWFSNEFNESWGWPEMCEEGGAEPMNDKQARYSHVRVIENTPARVIVHWRYHPTGICYNLIDTDGTPDGWGAASDFVFYIYPDGSSLSQNTLFSQQVNTWGEPLHGFEYHEAMIMHGPGAMPSQNIAIHDTVTVMNLDGQAWVFDGAEGGINNGENEPFVEDAPVNIARINLANTDYDTFTIMEPSPQNIIAPYWDDDFDNSTPDGHFVSWDHWPVNQIRAFGRGSVTNEYPSHTSLFHMHSGPQSAVGEDFQQRLFLTGLTNRDDAFVAALGRSWLQPPTVESLRGVAGARYDKTERAYQLIAEGEVLDFSLAGSADRPVINPAFVIRGWGSTDPATVRVDGELADARQGIARDADGAPTLVLFVPLEATAATRFEVCRGACR